MLLMHWGRTSIKVRRRYIRTEYRPWYMQAYCCIADQAILRKSKFLWKSEQIKHFYSAYYY